MRANAYHGLRVLNLILCMTAANAAAGVGAITREVWTGVSGVAVSAIPLATPPTYTGTLPSLEAPTNWADNYGQRLRGYLMAPATGSYTFWIASDDSSEFWLSTDDQPANKVLLCFVNGHTGVREWTKYTSQKSAAVNLVEGMQYYIEVLHKEGTGGDNLAVGWSRPGQGTTAPSEVVPGSVLWTVDSERLVVQAIEPATAVTASSAMVHGRLAVTSDPASTSAALYWGPTDGGTDPDAWTGGSRFWLEPLYPGTIVSHSITSLDADATYYYRFRASNEASTVWDDASSALITAPVTLAAVADASESGLVPGAFCVTRPASVSEADLMVYYVVGGTAVPGVNYAPLAGNVTIPAGQTTADIPVLPLADWTLQEDCTLELTLAEGSYLIGSPSTASITIANQAPASGVWTSAASSGTAYNWTDTPNWLDGIVPGGPGTSADLALDVTGSSTLTVNLRHDAVVGSLSLGDTGTGTGRPVTLANLAGETFRLTFDALSGDATLSGEGANNTISAGITLNDNLVINNASRLYLSGGVVGSGGIVKRGAGGIDLYSANTFTGGFTVDEGPVFGQGNTINVFGTGRLTINGGSINHGQSNGSALPNKVTIGGSFSMGNYVLSFNAGTTADAFLLNAPNPTVTITASTGGRQHAFNALISDGPSGGSGWTLECTTATGTDGVLRLESSASNTYAGKTRVPTGLLRLEKGGSAIAIPGDLDIGGHEFRYAIVRLNGASLNQIANTSTVTVLDKGTLDLNNRNETIGALGLATGGLVATGTGTGGTLTTTTLTVDGRPQMADTYTAADLPAFISGNGSVVVLTGPPPPTIVTIR